MILLYETVAKLLLIYIKRLINIDCYIKEYDEKFKEILAVKVKVINASIHFNIPQTSYKHLNDAYQEQKCAHSIYKLYSRQKSQREIWGKMLWSELVPQLLLDGMENLIKEFKKLPKLCRSLSVYLVLETIMKKYKNTIPLLIELKNDAMQESHWKLLLEKTGILFIVN